MAKDKAITITELSKRLGLSVATISSVLNNRHLERRISAQTVDIVRKAAAEAGYLPNISARRLRTYGANNYLVIAIITSYQAPLPLISASLSALHRVAQESAYQHMPFVTEVDMFDAGRLRDLPGLLDGSRFNGAIIANTIPEDDKFFAAHTIPIPVVFIGRDIPNCCSVRDLADQTGRQAAEILFSAGTKKPAILRPRLLTQTTTGRLKGFSEAVRNATGQEPDQIIAEGFREKDGYEAMTAYLGQKPPVDGLYALIDSLAVGAYLAIKQKGLRIPQDLAVIGTGDYPVAPYLNPPLSTFTRSQYNMHEEAVRLLLRQLTGEIKSPTQVVIPVIPVLRESTRRAALADKLPSEYDRWP